MIVRRERLLAQKIVGSGDEDSTDSGIGHRSKPLGHVSDRESRIKDAAQQHHNRNEVQPPHAYVEKSVHTPSIFEVSTLKSMIHEIIPVGMLQCNCSIFGDEQSREAIVIDPGDNIDRILAILARHSLKVKAIVITHAHIDHIGGAAKLKAATGAPVFMYQKDQTL